jgi:hypothetical protein
MTSLNLSRAERCAARKHLRHHPCGDGTDCVRFRAYTNDDYVRPVGSVFETVVLRTERINNASRTGNPRFRFHTESGIYTTADDIQQNSTLTGSETGAAELRIDNNRVAAWCFADKTE